MRCRVLFGMWGVVVASMLSVTACVTPQVEQAEPKGRTRTYYVLRMGERVPQVAPLPAMTPILVDWYYSDGSKESLVGFRGYDFSGDPRFEMVEVLGEDGLVLSRVFDFDGDGRVDQIINDAASDKGDKDLEAARLRVLSL